MCQDLGLEVGQTVRHDSRRGARCALPVDRDVDRDVRPQTLPARVTHRLDGGGVAERRRPRDEYAGPGPLQPAEGSGVVDVDPRVDASPLPATKQPTDVGVGQASVGCLEPGDHAGLEMEHRGDSGPEHPPMLARGRTDRDHGRIRLWTTRVR
jgi:hypothetical protein